MATTDNRDIVTSPSQKWVEAIASYEREFKKWENRSEKIVKIYRDFDSNADNRNTQSVNFNILWSNIQTLLPAVFSRLPKPDVSRRYRDTDPVGRVAALLLERALSFEVDHYPDYGAAMENCVRDRFLGGRGQAWVRYEPHIVALPGEPEDGLQVTDDADAGVEGEQIEEIEYECCPVDYVHWKDFGHVVARTWEEVPAVWRKVYMNRDALIKRFGEEIAYRIPLDTKPDAINNGNSTQNSSQDAKSQACIYEIWDKENQKAIWFSKTLKQIIDERPDPLKLECFFPCPRPLYATLTSDTLVPVPDYKQYQDQAQQLNKLAVRIDGLIKMLVVKGVYDAAIPELARLFKEAGNGDLIPVKSFQNFSEKAGLKGSIDIFDIAPIVAALNEAYQAMEAVKNEIYELMGISDIVRGSSDPQETYGAQKLKGQYGSMRLRSNQEAVVKFATELLQIKAQIICKHFQPENFLKIASAQQLQPADQQLIGPAVQLLMGDRATNPESETQEGPLMGFRIEVSSDSMVQMNEEQEKNDRVQFLGAVSGFLRDAMAAVQQAPQLAPLSALLLKYGVSGFKVGKTVEGAIDQMIDQLTQEAQNPQPKPSKEEMAAQANLQAEQQKAQLQAMLKDREIQAEKELELARQQFQAQEEQNRNQLEAQRSQLEARLEAQLEMQRQANARELESMRGQIQVLIASMNNEARLEQAQITAQTTLTSQQINAAESADDEVNR
jgi:hypothetical protein